MTGCASFESPKPGAPKPPALDGELGLLKEVENLVWLHLGGTDVTDQGLPHLAGLTSLTRLHLERTKVSDAGLAHLKDLQNLAYLNLYQTGITDAGLAHLEGLKGLKNLYLWQAKVTEAGVEKLQQALPDCKIDVGWKESEAAGRRGNRKKRKRKRRRKRSPSPAPESCRRIRGLFEPPRSRSGVVWPRAAA